MRHQAAEPIQALPVIAFLTGDTLGFHRIKHASDSIQCCALITRDDLHQPTTTARMLFTNIDLETMAMIGSFDVDQQGLGLHLVARLGMHGLDHAGVIGRILRAAATRHGLGA